MGYVIGVSFHTFHLLGAVGIADKYKEKKNVPLHSVHVFTFLGCFRSKVRTNELASMALPKH